jgi:hypothetical protein
LGQEQQEMFMFDGFWESFASAFTASFLVVFWVTIAIRLARHLISKADRADEAVVNGNNEMTGQSKP